MLHVLVLLHHSGIYRTNVRGGAGGVGEGELVNGTYA